MTRLLAIKIMHGYSSEARVFANLAAFSPPEQLQTCVFYNAWQPANSQLRKFQRDSEAEIWPFDFGWRSMSPRRRLSVKVYDRLRFLAALPRALAHARQFNPDVVYSSQQHWDCTAATFLARRLRKPHIIHLHYGISNFLHHSVLQRLRTCEHVITVSDYIRQQALEHGIAPLRATALLNSMSLPAQLYDNDMRLAVREELDIEPDAPVLTLVARVDPSKGQRDTVEAFARIAFEHQKARLLIVGADSDWASGHTKRVRQRAEELGVQDRVRFLGNRTDVPRLLNASDIFVHPSLQDPCPLAPLEAAASGLPVLAYAQGGIQECVVPGQTALLSKAGDVYQLSCSMQFLLENPELAKEMGRAGQRHIQNHFFPEARAQEFTSIVNRVVAAARPTQPLRISLEKMG